MQPQHPPRPPGAAQNNAPADAQQVVVTLDDASVKDRKVWQQAVQRLRSHGLDISRELDVIGIVAGRVAPAKVKALEADPNVVKVEPDERREVQRKPRQA